MKVKKIIDILKTVDQDSEIIIKQMSVLSNEDYEIKYITEAKSLFSPDHQKTREITLVIDVKRG